MSRRAAVLKAGAMHPLEGRRPEPFRVEDMMAEARSVVATARANAVEIVEQAEAEARSIRASARAEGHRDGREAGMKEGRESGQAEAFEEARQAFEAQHRSLVESCRAAIGTIEAGRKAWEAAARHDLVELAMAIARRVVHRVSERDRDVVLANLGEAVRLAGRRSEVMILVNPADAEAAERFASSLAEANRQWEHVEVRAARDVSPGGCRVQWGSGGIDASLDAQLDRIDAELLGSDQLSAISGQQNTPGGSGHHNAEAES